MKAVELVEAAQQAIAIGRPFNRHLTVHWEKAGLTDAQAASATGRLLKRIQDWVRKLGGDFAYAWVRENGDRKGSHTHILLHLPCHLKLALTGRWYRAVTGSTGRIKGAVRTVCIGGNSRCAYTAGEWYQAHLAKIVGYLLKGVDYQTGLALGLDHYADGGAIIGKRVSTSVRLRRGGKDGLVYNSKLSESSRASSTSTPR